MFALALVLLLLVVVAAGLRVQMAGSQQSSHASLLHLQGVQAAQLADSALEVAFARLAGAPNSECASAAFGPVDLGERRRYGVTDAAKLPEPVDVPATGAQRCNPTGKALACRLNAIGTVPEASRALRMDLALCTPEFYGPVVSYGGDPQGPYGPVEQTIIVETAPSIVFTSLSYVLKAPGVPDPVSVDLCTVSIPGGGCETTWIQDTLFGTRSHALGNRGSVVKSTNGLDYSISHTFKSSLPNKSADRDYIASGAIFEGFEGQAMSFVGQTSTKVQTGNFASVGSPQTSGANLTDGLPGWCRGADTLLLAISVEGDDTLLGASIDLGGATAPLTRLQAIRHTSLTMYSEVWYLHHPPSAGGIDALFGTPTSFGLRIDRVDNKPWTAGFACLSGVDPATPRGLNGSSWQPLRSWEP